MNPIKITTRKFPIPFRGPNSSADIKGFVDNTVADLIRLAENVTTLQGQLEYSNDILQTNEEYLRDATIAQASLSLQKTKFLIAAGYPSGTAIDYFVNLYDSQYVRFEGSNQLHGFYQQSIGRCYPPRNSVLNFFYIRDALQDYRTITRSPVVTFSIEPTVVPGTMFFSETDQDNMFNGDNHLYWVREYSYPLHSDVSSVNLEFTIQVPSGLGVDPNFIFLDPYPVLGMTIESVITNTGTIIGTPVVNATKLAYEVPAGTTSITVNVTQRAFEIHNGRKVFALGFREIDAQYITWDNNPNTVTPDTTGDNHVVLDIPLYGSFATLSEIKIDADVYSIDVTGYLANAMDANVYQITRTMFNNNQLLSPGFAFAGNVDRLRINVYMNADAGDNPNRIGHKIDLINSVSIRMS